VIDNDRTATARNMDFILGWFGKGLRAFPQIKGRELLSL
jgi:hypothetical protein